MHMQKISGYMVNVCQHGTLEETWRQRIYAWQISKKDLSQDALKSFFYDSKRLLFI